MLYFNINYLKKNENALNYSCRFHNAVTKNNVRKWKKRKLMPQFEGSDKLLPQNVRDD